MLDDWYKKGAECIFSQHNTTRLLWKMAIKMMPHVLNHRQLDCFWLAFLAKDR